LLAEVDRHVMQADRKETQPEQQWNIAQPGQANAPAQRNHDHEHRCQQETQKRQMHGVVGEQADMDAGRGIPQQVTTNAMARMIFKGETGACVSGFMVVHR
jgi:hypothetical protein